MARAASALRRVVAAALQQRQHQQQQASIAVLAGRALGSLAGATAPPDPPTLHCTGCGCGRGAPPPWRAAAPAPPARAQAAGTRAYRCCPGLDGAPPDRVVIEYDPQDVDT
jgi:hypothetical protein